MLSDIERDALEDIRDNIAQAMRFVNGLDLDGFLGNDKTFYGREFNEKGVGYEEVVCCSDEAAVGPINFRAACTPRRLLHSANFGLTYIALIAENDYSRAYAR